MKRFSILLLIPLFLPLLSYASIPCDPDWTEGECIAQTGCSPDYVSNDCADYNGDEGSCTTTEGCSWDSGEETCSGSYQGEYTSCSGTYDIFGCTNPDAANYNPEATSDDDSCYFLVYGCTDSLASNYNALANTEDGSCKYASDSSTLGAIAFALAIIVCLLFLNVIHIIFNSFTKRKTWR